MGKKERKFLTNIRPMNAMNSRMELKLPIS